MYDVAFAPVGTTGGRRAGQRVMSEIRRVGQQRPRRGGTRRHAERAKDLLGEAQSRVGDAP
jgi:hypothetical protein